jgi:hypothetical protein
MRERRSPQTKEVTAMTKLAIAYLGSSDKIHGRPTCGTGPRVAASAFILTPEQAEELPVCAKCAPTLALESATPENIAAAVKATAKVARHWTANDVRSAIAGLRRRVAELEAGE